MIPDNEIILHGGHPWPKHLRLNAGNLSINYENGNLRYISAGETEILRMIYFAVRDQEWQTLKPEISDETYEINNNSFIIKYKSDFRSGEIDFRSNFIIEGKSDNTLTLSFEGEAMSSFRKNRIGLCVLHPAEYYTGKSCIIEHTDGTTGQSFFPEEISPHQVFMDIRSMKWNVKGINCRIDFEGDIFETEDQRNWTDDSFKTYSTPLSIPFPATIEKGTRISQKVTFRSEGRIIPFKDNADLISVRLLPDDIVPLPGIGICQSGRNSALDKTEKKILRSLHFDHYRVDLNLFSSAWKQKAGRSFQEQSDLGWQFEFALFVDDNFRYQIRDFLEWSSEMRPSVKSLIIFHKDHPSTPDQIALEMIPFISEVFPDARIGTGTNANFAQINRNRPGDTGNDFICFSIHPQEHASDNYTLTENLKAQAYAVKSASVFAGNKKVFISPVTLTRRFKAGRAYYELPYGEKDMPPQVDSRQLSLFGACWTAGSLKYLCESEVESITYFESVGERGIIQGNHDSQWPAQIPSVKAEVFPVYFVFRYLLANKDMDVVKTISSHPHKIECMALTDGRKVRAMLVNLTGSVCNIKIECCTGLFRIKSLSSENFREAAAKYRRTGFGWEKVIKSKDNFSLEPCSLNFVEGWLRHS